MCHKNAVFFQKKVSRKNDVFSENTCVLNSYDLSRSNTQIAQDIEPTLSSLNWVMRLHPDADIALQERFEEIIQLIANNLGKSVGGIEPQIALQYTTEPSLRQETLPNQNQTFYFDLGFEKKPRATLLTSLPISEEYQSSFKMCRDATEKEESNDALDALSFPLSPSGGSGIQENGSVFGGMDFSSFAFTSTFISPKTSAQKQVIKSDFDVGRGISPLYPRLSKLFLPPKMPAVPLKENFKLRDFLNKLQKMALTNWLKAEVISPFVAGFLLFITYLRGDVLLPRSTALLYRRRQRGLSF